VRFVLADRRGTATYYRINQACVDCFPSAADIVMGKPAPEPPDTATPQRRVLVTESDNHRIISKYSQLARAALAGETITDCDGGAFEGGCFGAAAYADRSQAPEAAFRASLGCGNPLAIAELRQGETVLDLGSGAGLDVLLSARRVAPDGIAYGLDASTEMLMLARANADEAHITNARFVHGNIEKIPLPDEHVDVVISNCVINLSGDKPRVLAEAYRVLKPGGRLGVSDVIADERADRAEFVRAEEQVGCVAGTLTQAEYQQLLVAAGFSDVTITTTSHAADGLHSAIVQAMKPAVGQRDP
jgi:arsenite methyltransferase